MSTPTRRAVLGSAFTAAAIAAVRSAIASAAPGLPGDPAPRVREAQIPFDGTPGNWLGPTGYIGVQVLTRAEADALDPSHPFRRRETIDLGDVVLFWRLVPRWEVREIVEAGPQPVPIESNVDWDGSTVFISRVFAESEQRRCRLCEMCNIVTAWGPDLSRFRCEAAVDVDAFRPTGNVADDDERARLWSMEHDAPPPAAG